MRRASTYTHRHISFRINFLLEFYLSLQKIPLLNKSMISISSCVCRRRFRFLLLWLLLLLYCTTYYEPEITLQHYTWCFVLFAFVLFYFTFSFVSIPFFIAFYSDRYLHVYTFIIRKRSLKQVLQGCKTDVERRKGGKDIVDD